MGGSNFSSSAHAREGLTLRRGFAVTSDLTGCLRKAKEIAEAKWNTLYRKIREKLQADDSQRPAAAERSAIQSRDANCLAERDLYRGGTAVTYSVTLK